MCYWCVDIREATPESMPHQVQSILDLEGGQRGPSTIKSLWTKVFRRNRKGPKGKSKRRRITAVQDNGTPSSSKKSTASTTDSWAQVVNYVASTPSGEE